MSGFLGLPFEVRVIIYNYYVVVGRIYPYLERQLKEEEAQVDAALLATETTLPSLPMIEEKREYPALYLDLLQVNKKSTKRLHILCTKETEWFYPMPS